MNHRARVAALLILCLIAVVSPAAAEHAETLAFIDDDDTTKIITVDLAIRGGIVSERSVRVDFGHPPNLGHQKGNFTATLRARNGTTVFRFDVWDPRDHFEDHEINGSGYLAGSMWHKDRVNFSVILPWNPEIAQLELSDRQTGRSLITVNLTPACECFRNRFPRDPDVLRYQKAPLARQPDPSWFIAGISALALAALLIAFLKRP